VPTFSPDRNRKRRTCWCCDAVAADADIRRRGRDVTGAGATLSHSDPAAGLHEHRKQRRRSLRQWRQQHRTRLQSYLPDRRPRSATVSQSSQSLTTTIMTDFNNLFSLAHSQKICNKVSVKFNISPHLDCVATLLCEILIFKNHQWIEIHIAYAKTYLLKHLRRIFLSKLNYVWF